MSKLTDQFKELMRITSENAYRYQSEIEKLQNDTEDNKSSQDELDKSNEKTLYELSHVYQPGSTGFELVAIHRELMKINNSLSVIAEALTKGDEH